MQVELKDASIYVRIPEREANTFEGLSRIALETFYPEAYAMHLAFHDTCAQEPEQTQMCLS